MQLRNGTLLRRCGVAKHTLVLFVIGIFRILKMSNPKCPTYNKLHTILLTYQNSLTRQTRMKNPPLQTDSLAQSYLQNHPIADAT